MIRIALEATGGDLAPGSNLEGAKAAVEFAQKSGVELEVVLFGPQGWEEEANVFRFNSTPHLKFLSFNSLPDFSNGEKSLAQVYIHTPIRQAMRGIKSGQFHALVSAGRTGALVLAAILELDRCLGITRPAIGALIPTQRGWSLLIDVGASLTTTPHNLLQFALMGRAYCQKVLKISEPTSAILNVGQEPNSGGSVLIEAHRLIKEVGLPFIGNIEGRDLLRGESDIVLTNGFTGNVVLKLLETLNLPFPSPQLPVAFPLNIPSSSLPSYQLWGGQPLLGVKGTVIVAHGSSNATAIANAIWRAVEFSQINISQAIEQEVEAHFPTYLSRVRYLRAFRPTHYTH